MNRWCSPVADLLLGMVLEILMMFAVSKWGTSGLRKHVKSVTQLAVLGLVYPRSGRKQINKPTDSLSFSLLHQSSL